MFSSDTIIYFSALFYALPFVTLAPTGSVCLSQSVKTACMVCEPMACGITLLVVSSSLPSQLSHSHSLSRDRVESGRERE